MATTVIIVGCGIVGPVLAVMLKRKGLEPVIVEKVKENQDVGLSLALWPNGSKVLSTIGEAEAAAAGGHDFRHGMEFTCEGELLGSFLQSSFQKEYGYPAIGIRRSVLMRQLRDAALRQGVPIHDGWQLQDVRETRDGGVVAVAEDGREIQGSFLVGCDGLHSVTRNLVCERHGVPLPAPDFTGLVMMGGFSPTPASLPPGAACGWYGNAKYAVTYPVDDKYSVWALTTMGKDEERETWRQTDHMAREKARLTEELAGWPQPVRDLFEKSDSMVKFGLYDRPELSAEHWYHGRCVLVGDAAHPTSPHLGQGANQGLEDCWHLSQLLPDCKGNLSTAELVEAFKRYSDKRQARTSMLVKGARAQGELRVMAGEEECRQRNQKVRDMFANDRVIVAGLHNLYSEPF